MTETISNSFISIAVAPKGAELKSLKSSSGLEWMWQADPQYWNRTSPVLFPIVGRLINNQYRINANTFELSQHGFARDSVFELLEKKENQLSFKLSSNPQTRKVYPFDFELFIHYGIEKNELTVQYEVKNTGKEEMLFSLGAHPGFRCPLLKGEIFSDYFIEFEKEEKLVRHLVEGPYISGKTEQVQSEGKIVKLNTNLFGAKDAIILKNTSSQKLNLKNTKNSKYLTFDYSGFPWMAIWTKPGPFICLEPWFGIADTLGFNGELKDKDGIIRLASSKVFSCAWCVKISD